MCLHWLYCAEQGGDDADVFPKTIVGPWSRGCHTPGANIKAPEQQSPMRRTSILPTHMSLSLSGLLRGDTLPNRDGHPGAAGPADPSVVTASDLPPGLCAEGPGPHESQVS